MVKFTCGGRPAYVEVSCIEMIKEPCTNKGAYLSLANHDWIVVDESVEEVYAAIQKFWE
jgi:uncharacterized protein YlzI (FlbEa/FlbD family)